MIQLIVGNQGSGKTLFMAKMGLKAVNEGKKVYSNFKLNYEHTILTFDDLMGCKLNNCVVLLDEAHLWGLDSRDSLKRHNKALVKQFVVQVRKQGVILYICTQFPNAIDRRVRDNLDLMIACQKKILIDGKLKEVIQSENFPDHINIIELEVMRMYDNKVKYTGFIGNNSWGLYDTHEVIHMIDDDET